ncbi:anti-sigma factor family protein [Streptomyces fructofermentans]|uniref:Membrane protein n=1 Tax=Streptomyces fructofermentans TaxID=152141 RepID=A0A918U2S6_9ACTN|nr:zf-HC2 domain-containing protein [Streptomyces fructofermentans]GGX83423.1 membrane protein [Streptomyces fructofermentans]
MRSLERHRDVGAYALGVLDEADAFRFEDHLMDCAQCAVQIHEFGATTRSLRAYADATPGSVNPMTLAGPALLDRLLDDVAAARRSGRRRWLFAVAASVALAVGAPAAAVLAGGGSAKDTTVAATDPGSGVWAEVTTLNRAWGSEVGLKIKDADGPRSCVLVAVGRDSSEQVVMSWTGRSRSGEKPPGGAMQGAAALHPNEIARYEVRTSEGKRLVTLKAP